MGPIALFDKSFLQSLSIDESVWFDHFFYPNICPLFYVETLADLTKTNNSSGRSAEDEVRIIADKSPIQSGGPCANHRDLCIANLLGNSVPMTGQIPMAGGRPTKSPDGKNGVVYDESPESEAFTRWQHGDFREIERKFAVGWRQMLTNLDLPKVADKIRALGINSKSCKTIEDAHALAVALVHGREKPFEQMALLFTFVDIPPQMMQQILERWSVYQYRPLAEYAPYAAHVLVVELFFQIALAANLISAERASNRVDIAYFFYLPFCMVFISGDKLHRRCVEVFLRDDQDFIWGHDLKLELARLNNEFAKLPESELEKGVSKFATAPIGSNDDLLVKLWDKHTPFWRDKEKPVTLSPESEKKIVEQLLKYKDNPTASPQEVLDGPELDHMVIQRMVSKRKGNWWLLPKNLKVGNPEK